MIFANLQDALQQLSAKCDHITFTKYEPVEGYYEVVLVLSDVENITVTEHIDDLTTKLGEAYDAFQL